MSDTQNKIEQAIATRMGHNLPSEEQAIRDNMAELYRSYQPRVDELLADGAKIPEVIPEEMIPTVTDFIGACTTHVKKVDGTRKAEKDKYTRAGQVVDGFFKRLIDKIDDGNGNGLKWTIQKRLKAALDAKADRERREKEDAARKEREAADARKRAADELLRQEQERAAAAKREAEAAEARRLEQQRILQEEIRRDEERKRAATEQAERDRAAAEELARQNSDPVTGCDPANLGAEPMNTDGTGEPAAVSVETGPPPATPAPLSLAERLAVEERERLAGLAAKRTAAAAENAQRDLAEATREADRATNRATAATMQHAKVIAAPSADFARTRGDYGKVATLQDFWDISPVDRDQLDKRAIWKFITDEALEQAVRAYRDSFAGQEPKPLKGVTFFKNTRGQVR